MSFGDGYHRVPLTDTLKASEASAVYQARRARTTSSE